MHRVCLSATTLVSKDQNFTNVFSSKVEKEGKPDFLKMLPKSSLNKICLKIQIPWFQVDLNLSKNHFKIGIFARDLCEGTIIKFQNWNVAKLVVLCPGHT